MAATPQVQSEGAASEQKQMLHSNGCWRIKRQAHTRRPEIESEPVEIKASSARFARLGSIAKLQSIAQSALFHHQPREKCTARFYGPLGNTKVSQNENEQAARSRHEGCSDVHLAKQSGTVRLLENWDCAVFFVIFY